MPIHEATYPVAGHVAAGLRGSWLVCSDGPLGISHGGLKPGCASSGAVAKTSRGITWSALLMLLSCCYHVAVMLLIFKLRGQPGNTQCSTAHVILAANTNFGRRICRKLWLLPWGVSCGILVNLAELPLFAAAPLSILERNAVFMIIVMAIFLSALQVARNSRRIADKE